MTHVAVKVRTAAFFTRSKISKLAEPTTDPSEVARAAGVVLDRFQLNRPIRLLGVRVVLEPPTRPTVRSGISRGGRQQALWRRRGLTRRGRP